jgi:hypothetical protein
MGSLRLLLPTLLCLTLEAIVGMILSKSLAPFVRVIRE